MHVVSLQEYDVIIPLCISILRSSFTVSCWRHVIVIVFFSLFHLPQNCPYIENQLETHTHTFTHTHTHTHIHIQHITQIDTNIQIKKHVSSAHTMIPSVWFSPTCNFVFYHFISQRLFDKLTFYYAVIIVIRRLDN